MSFNKELAFESALINLLFEKGWEKNVLKNKTEKELLQNWADILFENNRGIDRLNDYPLTEGEMQQIVEHAGRVADRDGKAERLIGSGHHLVGVDAHHLAPGIHERAAGIAGIHGSVRLDIGQAVRHRLVQLAVQAGHITARERVAVPLAAGAAAVIRRILG